MHLAGTTDIKIGTSDISDLINIGDIDTKVYINESLYPPTIPPSSTREYAYMTQAGAQAFPYVVAIGDYIRFTAGTLNTLSYNETNGNIICPSIGIYMVSWGYHTAALSTRTTLCVNDVELGPSYTVATTYNAGNDNEFFVYQTCILGTTTLNSEIGIKNTQPGSTLNIQPADFGIGLSIYASITIMRIA